MKNEDRDAYTGHRMTSHDWNGIRELNTKIPKFLLWCLALAFVYSLISWYLLPAWPSFNTFSKGLLQTDQRLELSDQIQRSAEQHTTGREAFMDMSFEEITADSGLLAEIDSAAGALYGDNCMVCHGAQGKGALAYPRLNDSSWLWGGEPEQILKTIKVGINSGAADSRQALMPALGKDNVIPGKAVEDVAIYIRSLSSPALADGSNVTSLQAMNRGAQVYKSQCAACHGPDAKGNHLLGAPNLSDDYWIYGGSKEAVEASIHSGRGGHMPAWDERLSDYELKVLAVYVSRLAVKSEVTNTEENP